MKKARKRCWLKSCAIILIFVIMTASLSPAYANDSVQDLFWRIKGKSSSSEDVSDDNQFYEIDCNTVSSWEDRELLSVRIRNTGTVPIDNWAVSFSMKGSVQDIWNAYVCSNVEDYWLLRHLDYNRRIPVGGEMQVGS